MRTLRACLAVLVVLLAVLSLPGPDPAAGVHALRTELAEATVELRIARAHADGAAALEAFGGGSASGAFAAGRPAPLSHGSDLRQVRVRVHMAERRVRHLEHALAEAVAEASGEGLPAGLVGQLRTLMRPPRDEDTAGRLEVPVRGVVTSGFGPRAVPSWGTDNLHDGIDIFAPGGTPVTAAASGKVSFAGRRDESGLSVTIDHGYDHLGRRLHTVYSHLSVIEVGEGDRVRTGDVLGAVGNTGAHSTGPHLHFEVRLEGHAVDPRAWL